MKRVPLALAFLVVAGTASAAIFDPPSVSPRQDRPLTKISATAKSSGPLVDAARAPVPLPHLPKPPPLDLAALAQSPPAAATSPAQPPIPSPRANAAIRHGAEKEVRVLSDTRCGGRTMKSITVLPDGRVLVDC
jgi:hypothetical protein